MDHPYFTDATFEFLAELAAHNERAWFAANKPRYEEHVKGPALQFITDFGPILKEISPHFRAVPKASGGSLFRIYRDTRFSKDKSPYKTHTGIHFRHDAARDAHAPGFYLHIQPGNCFAGCGVWRPSGPALRKIRESIDEDPAAWKRASRGARFRGTFELTGDSLIRAPKGYTPDHPLIEDLRRKDFIGMVRLNAQTLTAADFLETFARFCRDGAAFQRWLCRALGVPY